MIITATTAAGTVVFHGVSATASTPGDKLILSVGELREASYELLLRTWLTVIVVILSYFAAALWIFGLLRFEVFLTHACFEYIVRTRLAKSSAKYIVSTVDGVLHFHALSPVTVLLIDPTIEVNPASPLRVRNKQLMVVCK